MNERLQRLFNWFRHQGLSVELIPGCQSSSYSDFWVDQIQIMIQLSLDLEIPDYKLMIMAGAENVVSVSIWHIGMDKIGEFWTNNPNEIIPLSLLTIASCDSALSNWCE